MPKRTDIDTILIIGAGPIIIGQACEFDYSGTQGIKALKEEGYRVVLINSNPATIMTDKGLADVVYIEPITPEFIEQIIKKERPQVILPTLGGQTALNAALKLEEMGILAKYNVGLIGVSIEAIKKAEDRGLFKDAMARIGLKCPESIIISEWEHGFDNLCRHICLNFGLGIDFASEIRGILPLLSEYEQDTLTLYIKNLEDGNAQFFEEQQAILSEKNAAYVSLPVIIRPSLTLGGTGGGVAETLEDYVKFVKSGLEASPISQIQVDKSIMGWKEFEMEVVRDKNDNAIIVCAIENLDPMGVHTGDSITIAPALTLTDKEYQKMRDASLAILREIGVETGGSNVQFAVNPRDGEMVVIEMNPRVSRSSALASKATGFPIAKIAAKLAIGYTLDELRNDIACSAPRNFGYTEYKKALNGTGGTDEMRDYISRQLKNGKTMADLHQEILPASFEPAIDYIVVKIPKFNFEKFNTKNPELGTQMQSVGEVMALGRSFEEAFLKAVSGIESAVEDFSKLTEESLFLLLKSRSPNRVYVILEALRRGISVAKIAELSHYDKWFLQRFEAIVRTEREISAKASAIPSEPVDFFKRSFKTQEEVRVAILSEQKLFEKIAGLVTQKDVLRWKQAGFRDGKIRELLGLSAGISGVHLFKEYRKFLGVTPVFKKIDSCAGEFASSANYFYSTYEAEPFAGESANEAEPSGKKKVVIIGSGPNRVGQGIEFDYACVGGCMALSEMGIESVMINCNPETVSTDYDTSNRLFFEPLSDEHVMNVIENEQKNGELLGVIVQLGGQTPLRLRATLKAAGIKILGMEKDAIDLCDNRVEFAKLVDELGIKQAESFEYKTRDDLLALARKLEFKFIIRPSSVIGGRGMAIFQNEDAFKYYFENEKELASGVVNPLLQHAVELDVDAMRDKFGNVFVFGVLEHIEYAGVHSGDSSCSIPTRLIGAEIKAKLEQYVASLAAKLNVTGLINVQFAVKDGEIYVIEANPRASRTVPFTAKAIGLPLVKIAVKLMCGGNLLEDQDFIQFTQKTRASGGYYVLEKLERYAIKEPVFSFEKFASSDIVRGPEMRSLGEVMGLDKTFGLAYAKAIIATGYKFKTSGRAFISVNQIDKNERVIELAKSLTVLGFDICGTSGTADFLSKNGIQCEIVPKVREGGEHIVKLIDTKKIDFTINTVSGFKSLQDGFFIRRAVVRNKVLHSTTIEGAFAILEAIKDVKAVSRNLEVMPI